MRPAAPRGLSISAKNTTTSPTVLWTNVIWTSFRSRRLRRSYSKIIGSWSVLG